MPTIIAGEKPISASGIQNGSSVISTHCWRSAVERLKCWLEWCTTCWAQKSRTSWWTRW